MRSITVPTHFTHTEARLFSRLLESFIDFLLEFDHGLCDHYDLWRDEQLDVIAQEEELHELLDCCPDETVPPDPPERHPRSLWDDDDVPW